MTREDDRTPEQKETHTYLIVGTDTFMSDWGGATGGASIAAWACGPDTNTNRVFNWVQSRSDMTRVRDAIDGKGSRYSPKCEHLHIYVVGADHPANRF